MRPKRKEWTIIVPQPLDKMWAFFSRPENLNELTPKEVSFEMLSPVAGVEMYPGMVLQYRISPMAGIKVNWLTEITQIREKEFFIDDQRAGPFALWHHQHHFRALDDNRTEMKDILHYQVPLGPLGNFANWLFVERQVNEIFRFREEAIRQYFG